MLARVVQYPSIDDERALLYLMGYLKRTKKQTLEYSIQADHNVVVYSDAAFAQDPDSSKSRTGVTAICHGAAISWKSILQKTVAASTGESEYMALYLATTTAISIREQLICLLRNYTYPIPLKCDNQAAIILATTEEIKSLNETYKSQISYG